MSKNQNRIIFACSKAQEARLEEYRKKIGWLYSRADLIRYMLDKVMDNARVARHDDEDERKDETTDTMT